MSNTTEVEVTVDTTGTTVWYDDSLVHSTARTFNPELGSDRELIERMAECDSLKLTYNDGERYTLVGSI